MTMARWPAEALALRGRDLSAGLCVAGLLLPEAVAYAGLAQLPVSQAFSAVLAGLVLYALFGGSRFAVVAPTSSSATLAAAATVSVTGVAGVGAAANPSYGPALLGLVLLAGLALMLLALARQGQLSAFISRPVLRGFAFALALTIVIRQLPDALGLVLSPATATDPLHVLLQVMAHSADWHGASLAVAGVAAAGMALLRRWPQLPGALLVIIAAMLAAQWLNLAGHGVALVGLVLAPPLQLGLPALSADEWIKLAELAVGLVVLIFAESWGSIRSLALAHGDTVNADRELLVLGACNVGAALLQGMPVGAGFSASQANATAGATSRWAGGFAALVVAGVLLGGLPWLQWLPRPVLAVLVMTALWHALDPRPLHKLWQLDRDRLPLLGAVLAVISLGVLHGMLAAIGLSLVDALRRFSRPVVHALGRMGSTSIFVVIEAHADAVAVPGLLILRPEEPLFFASAERVMGEVMARVAAQPGAPLRAVVLSLEESSDIDSTTLECLQELNARLARRGLHLVLSRVKDRVRALLQRADPQGLGAPNRLHYSVNDAVQALQAVPGNGAPQQGQSAPC